MTPTSAPSTSTPSAGSALPWTPSRPSPGWDEGPDDPHVSWTRSTWQRLHPWSAGGSYVNHLAADEGNDRVREAYGAKTWDRLVALKRRVDPDNRFHLNQNISPG